MINIQPWGIKEGATVYCRMHGKVRSMECNTKKLIYI